MSTTVPVTRAVMFPSEERRKTTVEAKADAIRERMEALLQKIKARSSQTQEV